MIPWQLKNAAEYQQKTVKGFEKKSTKANI
jgi:hypothetical protein